MTTHPPILALDVDGVIIDGFPKARWDVDMEADLGITREEVTKHFFAPHWQGIMLGKTHMMPVLADALLAIGTAVSAQEFVDYWHGKDANVRQDVIEAALVWKSRVGGKVVLATNQEHVRARYLWEVLCFQDHFDEMVASCRIGAAKPEANYFVKADAVIGRLPNQSVIFLDDLEDNVATANAHGWQAHLVSKAAEAAGMIARL